MKKLIVFLLYCFFALSMGFTMFSCKKEKVNPIPVNNNNNNNNTVILPTKHSMVVDSSTKTSYYIADTNSLHMYSDPTTGMNLRIHSQGIYGGTLDIYLNAYPLINNGGVYPVATTSLDINTNYAIYTDPDGKVYTNRNMNYLGSNIIMVYDGTTHDNLYCGFTITLQSADGKRIRLNCEHAYIKIG